jgi:FeS assembly SUF system regulator
MIQLSKHADDALLLMTHLASQTQDQMWSAKALSEAVDLPYPTVSKILKRLVKGDCVLSVQGAHGGYRLARRASQINMAELIEAVDGPIALTLCSSGSLMVCAKESTCMVKPHWNIISHVIKDALGQIPLSALTKPLKQNGQRAEFTPIWNQYFEMEGA